MSSSPCGPTQQEIEDHILQRLAAVGLVVPTRDPERPCTPPGKRCRGKGVLAVSAEGGRPFYYRAGCRTKGCARGCAAQLAEWETQRIRATRPGFSGVTEVYHRGIPVYARSEEAVRGDALWVTLVPTASENSQLARRRLTRRAKNLVKSGVRFEYACIPCDGAIIIVSTTSLAQTGVSESRLGAPTSGWWCPTSVALLFLGHALASTAVSGQIWWSLAWRPTKVRGTTDVVVFGTELVAKTACQILQSEDYEFSRAYSDADPGSVLLEAKGRAQLFWRDPRCSVCGNRITPQEVHWWRGEARCRGCYPA